MSGNDQPEVKCPEAALAERDATITFLRGELAERSADYDDMLREKNKAEAELAEARAEIDAALAVVHAPDSTNDGGAANLAEEMQRLVDNNTDLNAEVERLRARDAKYEYAKARDEAAGLRLENHELREGIDGLHFQIDAANAEIERLARLAQEGTVGQFRRDIAAERQRIAEAVDALQYIPEFREHIFEEIRSLRDRIASGHFAQQGCRCTCKLCGGTSDTPQHPLPHRCGGFSQQQEVRDGE